MDPEAASKPASAPPPASKRRAKLFAAFSCVAVGWCTFLLFMMHDLQSADRLAVGVDYMGADIDSRYGLESAADKALANFSPRTKRPSPVVTAHREPVHHVLLSHASRGGGAAATTARRSSATLARRMYASSSA